MIPVPLRGPPGDSQTLGDHPHRQIAKEFHLRNIGPIPLVEGEVVECGVDLNDPVEAVRRVARRGGDRIGIELSGPRVQPLCGVPSARLIDQALTHRTRSRTKEVSTGLPAASRRALAQFGPCLMDNGGQIAVGGKRAFATENGGTETAQLDVDTGPDIRPLAIHALGDIVHALSALRGREPNGARGAVYPNSVQNENTPPCERGALPGVPEMQRTVGGRKDMAFDQVRLRPVRDAGERCVDIQTEIALGGSIQGIALR